MKVGDVIVSLRPIEGSTEGEVTKVGRVWAETTLGRVLLAQNSDGTHDVEYTGGGSQHRVFPSAHAARLAAWKEGAGRALARDIARVRYDKLQAEKTAAALEALTKNKVEVSDD